MLSCINCGDRGRLLKLAQKAHLCIQKVAKQLTAHRTLNTADMERLQKAICVAHQQTDGIQMACGWLIHNIQFFHTV